MSSNARSIIGILDATIDVLLVAFFACVLAFGAYGVYDSYLVGAETRGDAEAVRNVLDGNDDGDGRTIEGKMVARLRLDGAGIDLPVMQGNDNVEYLNKNPFGEDSLSGSAFLDFRNADDFADELSVVYGHAMEGGEMFGSLVRYEDEKWLKSHEDGVLTLNEKDEALRVFAVLETDANDASILDPKGTKENALGTIERSAIVLDEEAKPKENENLLVLVTCKRPDSSERIVVAAAFEPYGSRDRKEASFKEDSPT